MRRLQPKPLAFALTGMILGYLVWSVILMAIILLTPIYYWWVTVAAVTLIILTSAAFFRARKCKGRAIAFAYWFAPLLPSITSAYIVVLAFSRY